MNDIIVLEAHEAKGRGNSLLHIWNLYWHSI